MTNEEALDQQPCDDCISRQAVLDAIDVKAWEFCDYLIREGRNDEQQPVSHFADNLRECVGEDLPPVTPKEKTGRWISFGVQGEIDGQIVRAFTCSKCGAISIFRVSNRNIVNGDLCPNCGAKMIEPQESEDRE